MNETKILQSRNGNKLRTSEQITSFKLIISPFMILSLNRLTSTTLCICISQDHLNETQKSPTENDEKNLNFLYKNSSASFACQQILTSKFHCYNQCYCLWTNDFTIHENNQLDCTWFMFNLRNFTIFSRSTDIFSIVLSNIFYQCLWFHQLPNNKLTCEARIKFNWFSSVKRSMWSKTVSKFQ